jgi:GT2 family glycosyltransferase
MKPRVTIVIPNWNGQEHLAECFAALAAQQLDAFRVLLIDNASTDESVAWMREHHPDIEVVQMPENGGFSYAVNEGIRRADTEYVALLNNDTAVDPGWLRALVTALDERPDYDIAASRMLLYSDPDVVNAAGDVFSLLFMAGKNRGFFKPDRYDEPVRVFGACAGAALYRRRLFDEIGLFDEDYFVIAEDTDLNFRAFAAGKKCIYVPDARLLHKWGATIKKEPAEWTARLQARNDAMMITKNLPAGLLPLLPALWGLREAVHHADIRPRHRERFKQRLKRVPARMAAELEGVRMGLRKRGKTQSGRRVGSLTTLRWLVHGVGDAGGSTEDS